ncbi:hypothetical protein [Methanocalculus sp. MC3]
MKKKNANNKYDDNVPVSPENPLPMTREMIFAFEHWSPEMKGVGRSMIKQGLWFVPEPLSAIDQTYPDPLTEEMAHPFKIRRSIMDQLIEREPFYKDLEEQNVRNQVWMIIEDHDDTQDSDCYPTDSLSPPSKTQDNGVPFHLEIVQEDSVALSDLSLMVSLKCNVLPGCDPILTMICLGSTEPLIIYTGERAGKIYEWILRAKHLNKSFLRIDLVSGKVSFWTQSQILHQKGNLVSE